MTDDEKKPEPKRDEHGFVWCDTNACEEINCHRCFPFPDCTVHEKCRETR